MTEIAERTPMNALVARIRDDKFKNEIAIALPGNVTPDRFVRAAVTALMQNPDVAKADQNSLLQSLMRCAQDGLLPDNKEAAIVLFGNKATYLPMIGGLRKLAAEYGWQITTDVVFENDTFDYVLGMQPDVTHKPARLGTDRGKAIGAYAVATHRDGRKLMEVMTEQDIEKVRQSSRSKNSGPWTQWTDRMREKTVGRRLFSKLPLSDVDRDHIERVLAADDYDDPVAALYGPDTDPVVEPPAHAFDPDTGEVIEEGEYEEAAVAEAEDAIAAEAALAAVVPIGANKGKTLKELLDMRPLTDPMLVKMLKHDWKGNQFEAALLAVVKAHAPELMDEVLA